MRQRALIAVALVAIILAGCARGVDRGNYIEKNNAVLETLPAPPGGKLVDAGSYGVKDGESPWAATVAFSTTRDYDFRKKQSVFKTLAYYRRALRPAWRVTEIFQQAMNLRRGDASLHINAGADGVVLGVDHACYAGGRAARCFDPPLR